VPEGSSKARVIITEKYVKEMTARLVKWRTNGSSMAFFKFLQKERLGWSLFKKICEHYPEVRNEFEVTCSCMASRWLDYAMDHPKLPAHLEKVMMRYLRFYDMHTFDQETAARGQIEGAKATAIAEFIKDDYSKAPLDVPFKQIYEKATEPTTKSDERRGS